MVIQHTDWDDPIRDGELPDEDDLSDGDTPALVLCASCGELLPDDAQRCRSCGDWVTHWSAADTRSRGWFWPVVVAGLIAIILVIWHGLGR